MTIMAVMSRRSARKSEPNLNDTRPIHSTSRECHGSATAGADNATGKRRRHWFWFWRTRPRPSPMTTITAPSSPTPLSRSTLTCRLFDHSKYYIKKRHPCVVIVGAFLIYCLNFLVIIYFGPRGSIRGGHIGDLWDILGRDYIRYQTISKWRKEVRSNLHIPIVYREKEGALVERWYHPLDPIIKTRPNCAIVEMLLRETRRVQKLESMVQYASTITENCSRGEISQVDVPSTVLQLLPQHEQQPLPPYWIARFDSIDLDFIAIHNSDISDTLSHAIKSCQDFVASNYGSSADHDLNCVAQHVGGIRLGNYFALQQSRPLVENMLSLMDSSISSKHHKHVGGGTCNSRVGYAIFSNKQTPNDELRKTSAISSHVSTIFAAFPPNHPGALCIPPFENTIGISPYNEANKELSFYSTFANKLLTEIDNRAVTSNSSIWGLATLSCDISQASENEIPNCCNQVSVTILDSADAKDIAKHLETEHANKQNNKQRHHLIFTSKEIASNNQKEISSTQSDHIASVKISEPNSLKSHRHAKETIQMKLSNKWNCEPGWFCNRCLRSPVQGRGSFANCSSVCGECAINAICNGDDMPRHHVKVQITGLQHLPPTTSKPANIEGQNRIPRIIHQTYFEEITMEKYPQLFRLQNRWRASGWEYRFYTDDTARKYIEANYPDRFVSVFDSLLPGAYKADFFRYLVLFKEGGIYADVDVLLDSNLDSFITPDLAFFAPIDAVGNFADEQFCLWNGLLGSAPAHPFLANVIEWMVNLVSNRGDIYDIEQTVCKYSGVHKTENWKLRLEPGLMLSGPCALGLALNNALGNEPLTKFSPGLLTWKGYNNKNISNLNGDAIGNVMLLLADKNDLGAFRFSDPERNIMIASTDLSGLSKAPMVYESSQNLRSKGSRVEKKPHYSISNKGDRLWGTHDVYADDLVHDDLVSLVLSYKA